jgi:hypothetical protein
MDNANRGHSIAQTMASSTSASKVGSASATAME